MQDAAPPPIVKFEPAPWRVVKKTDPMPVGPPSVPASQLSPYEATRLHEFAMWCAEQVADQAGEAKDAALAAIKAKRDWMALKAGGEEAMEARRAELIKYAASLRGKAGFATEAALNSLDRDPWAAARLAYRYAIDTDRSGPFREKLKAAWGEVLADVAGSPEWWWEEVPK